MRARQRAAPRKLSAAEEDRRQPCVAAHMPRAGRSILALTLAACAAPPQPTALPAAGRESARTPPADHAGWLVVIVPIHHGPASQLTEVLQELLASAHGIACTRTHCY